MKVKKLLRKYQNLSPIMKISIWIWLLTFILLIIFVVFALVYQQQPHNNPKLNNPYTNEVIWANLLTVSGLLFVCSLFAGLLTTAIPQITKKKKSKGGK